MLNQILPRLPKMRNITTDSILLQVTTRYRCSKPNQVSSSRVIILLSLPGTSGGQSFVDPELGDTGLELEPQGFQASKWTSKYHLSPIYVVHPYEGYRGQFDNCIAVTKHNILHLDELIIDVEGKPWHQEVYRYFDTDTQQNFMNLSANQRMGVAILKEVRYPVNKYRPESYRFSRGNPDSLRSSLSFEG